MSSRAGSSERGTADPGPLPDPDEPALRYAGLATRILSFTVDAALISLVAIIVSVGAALILTLLHFSKNHDAVLAVIGTVAYILWACGYFVAFWSTTGQTPGARALQIRVLTSSGEKLKPLRALTRCVGVVLAAWPLFLGFVPILFDGRRRGFQDWLARTVVVEAPQLSVAQMLGVRQQAKHEASRQVPSGNGYEAARSSLPGDDAPAAALDGSAAPLRTSADR